MRASSPRGWVAVGDPAEILPPGEHDRIWAVQEPLDFPGTVYGVARAPAGKTTMPEITRRLAEAPEGQRVGRTRTSGDSCVPVAARRKIGARRPVRVGVERPLSDQPEVATSTAGAPLLRVSRLRYAYGRDVILRDVAFQVDAGELVVLAGRNGAGKSTLLRCVAGWTTVTSGTVLIAGQSLEQAEREARRQLVLVPDMPVFYDALTAWEHLRLVAGANRIPAWEPQAEELLRHFGLWDDRDDYPYTFSRGMRYKLALCLALLVEPPLLLLDEPLGPLDPVSADQLWRDLGVYREAGTGILLSSHQLPADVQPDRYLLMEQGEIVGDGSPAALRGRLGLPEHPTLEALLRAAIVDRTARVAR